MELPLFVINHNIKRKLIPKTVLVILLAAVFYAILLVNLYLLEIELNLFYNILIIIGAILLVILQIFLDYTKISISRYEIYNNRIVYTSKKTVVIPLNQVTMLNFKRDWLDTFFNSGDIQITQSFKLESIEDVNPAYFNLQKMLQNPQYFQNQQSYIPQMAQNYNYPGYTK